MSNPYGGWDDRSQGYGRPAPPPPLTQPPPYPYGAPAGYGAPPARSSPEPVPWGPAPLPLRPQRPAVIATSTTLAITGSLVFGCGLAFLWLVASGIRAEFDPTVAEQTVFFHIAERFHLRLTQGLAFPLFGFPVAAVVAAFLLPVGRRWGRLVLTAVGVAALAWSAWWLRARLGWWVPGAVYVGLTCAILWLPGVSRWYALTDPPRVAQDS